MVPTGLESYKMADTGSNEPLLNPQIPFVLLHTKLTGDGKYMELSLDLYLRLSTFLDTQTFSRYPAF
jgi:hypothetical protein